MIGESRTGTNTVSEQSDWATEATTTVVRYVGTVRDKTTGPALVASRYAVYLLAMALIAMLVVVIGLVLLVRGLVVVTGYLPFVEAGETWLAYYVIGLIFVLAGGLLWRKKESRAK